MQGKAEKLIKSLGKIIEKHRKETGKSMYKISAESSISKTSWRRIEKALHKDINLTSLWKIAYGLDITPDDLIKELREELGENFILDDEEKEDTKENSDT